MNYSQLSVLGGQIHQGFYRTLDLVWQQVHEQVRRQWTPDTKLWVTGHSQGGALAVVAGARLKGEGITPTSVYTFGAPRVGDLHFAASYESLVHRIEYGNDIVCHLPPPPTVMTVLRPLLNKLTGQRMQWVIPENVDYKHVGRLSFIDWDGQLIEDHSGLATARLARLPLMFWSTGERQTLLSHHSIDAYVERLGKLLSTTREGWQGADG
jgi:hypothetical protein